MMPMPSSDDKIIQQQFIAGEIKPERKQKIVFREYVDTNFLHVNLKTRLLSTQEFFLYKGVWRNINPHSEFGELVYREDLIPPVVFWWTE